MPQIPKHIPIQMLFIVCNFKMPHPIHDILFLVHTVHLQLEILYAFPTPPTTSSPSPFRGCTFRSFGRSLPFRYASQIRLNCIQPSNLYSISCIAHHTPTCSVYFDTPTAHADMAHEG